MNSVVSISKNTIGASLFTKNTLTSYTSYARLHRQRKRVFGGIPTFLYRYNNYYVVFNLYISLYVFLCVCLGSLSRQQQGCVIA